MAINWDKYETKAKTNDAKAQKEQAAYLSALEKKTKKVNTTRAKDKKTTGGNHKNGANMTAEAKIYQKKAIEPLTKKLAKVTDDAFDQKEDYTQKFKKGNVIGGAANFIGSGLTAAQSIYLNALNNADSLAHGDGLQDFMYNMSNDDYQRAVVDRRGGGDTINEMADKKSPVLGAFVRTIGEIATDPLELTPAGTYNDIKTVRQGVKSPGYAIDMQKGKLSQEFMPRPAEKVNAQDIIGNNPTSLDALKKANDIKADTPVKPQTSNEIPITPKIKTTLDEVQEQVNNMAKAQERSHLNANEQQMLDAIEKRSGAKIEFADNLLGSGEYRDGIITISRNSADPVMDVLKHELTHHLETSDNYADFADFVKSSLKENKVDIDNTLKDIITDYDLQGIKLTTEQAEKEMIAKYTQEFLFANEKSIERLCRDKPSLARQIYEWIVDKIEVLKAGADRAEVKQLIEAQRKYEKALDTVGANIDDGTKYMLNGDNTLRADNGSGGYNGKSMSNRAVRAYQNGEMPKSKWNKKSIIEAIEDYAYDNDIDLTNIKLNKLTTKELQDTYLKNSSWHHTGAMYNKTDFYNIDENKLANIEANQVENIINSRLPKLTTELERVQKAREKKTLETAKEIYDKLDIILNSNITGLKSIQAVANRWKSGKLDIEKVYEEAVNSIKAADANKIRQWSALPENHFRQKAVRQYNDDIAEYIKDNHLSKSKSNKILQDIKKQVSNNQDTASYALKDKNLSEGQQNYFKNAKTLDEKGNLKKYYHGTGRADRVENAFLPDRATSGPMAFFTDNKEIAERYSKDKIDTSIKYDNVYDDYHTQFRTSIGGKDVPISELWNKLPASKQKNIIEKAKHITLDEDGEKIIFNTKNQHGLGNFDEYELNAHNGNAIDTLISSWLDDGNLFGEEERFQEVLKLVGLNDVRYMNPNAKFEKVYEEYLNLTNPFETSQIDANFVSNIKKWLKDIDLSKYEKESFTADMWDKNNIKPEVWINRLEDDIKKGTTHAWTSIPDYITDFLKKEGYDGIIDSGGKNGGAVHEVAIPFYPNQIKNIDNVNPTAAEDIRYAAGRNLSDISGKNLNKLKHSAENLYLPKGKEKKYNHSYESPNTTDNIDKSQKSTTGEKKAATYQSRAEKDFANKMLSSMGVDKYADTKKVKKIIHEMFDKSKKGTLSTDDKEELLTQLMGEGILVNKDMAEMYADLKRNLRNIKLHVDENTVKNIADYNDFRKSNMGSLKLSKNDGINIDKKYHELMEEYPELFREVNTTEEMLQEMSIVAKQLKVSEEKLTDIYGRSGYEFYDELEKSFNEAMDEIQSKAEIVRKYVDSKQKTVEADISLNEAKRIVADIKTDKRKLEKIKERILLTEKDDRTIDRLLKGDITLEDIRNDKNYKNIKSVYEASIPIKEKTSILKNIGNKTRKVYNDEIRELLTDSSSWKDKKAGALFSRETAERNMVDIAGKQTGGKINKKIFTPIHENEAISTKMKNAIRDDIRDLGISDKPEYGLFNLNLYDAKGLDMTQKASESTLVQLYGENLITKKQLKLIGADVDKITNAVTEMRKIYDTLIDEANTELVKHGYEPIEYRKDYFPHFEENTTDSVLGKIGRKLGFNVDMDELPTDIAGLTHTFRPGKKFFANALTREGTRTTYDALKGMDLYLEGISDVIYHTEDIQKLRRFERELRIKYSDVGIKKRIKDIMYSNLDETTKEAAINAILDEGHSKNSNLAVWLRNYTDNLAGKKYVGDRHIEHQMGRGVYNISKALENRVAANMVAVNPGSWLTNFIPLVQASEVSNKNLIKGMIDTMKNYGKNDGFEMMSNFLTNRIGSETLYKSNTEKIQHFMTAPMKVIDEFTSNVLTRAMYKQGIEEGLSHSDALAKADRLAADVIADRSKGAVPTMFTSKNPISKIFTMYQLEVNNQWSHLFKDIPRTEENVTKVAFAYCKFAIGAYLFNELYEKAVGRRPALDPLSWANSLTGDLTGKKLSNIYDVLTGESNLIEDIKPKTAGGAVTALGKNVAEDTPFIGGLIGGGRVPISNALPSLPTLASNTTDLISGDKNSKVALANIGKEIMKPATYLLPPVGGGQVKKVYESSKAFIDKGVYGLNEKGEQELKFAVDNNDFPKGLLFGQYAMGNAQDYIDSTFKRLNAKKTTAYQYLVKTGMQPTAAENFLREMPKKQTEAREYIMSSNLTSNQKNAVGKSIGEKTVDYSNPNSYKITTSLDKDGQDKINKVAKDTGKSKEVVMKAYEAQQGEKAGVCKAMDMMDANIPRSVMKAYIGGKNPDVSLAKAELMRQAKLSTEDYTYIKDACDSNDSGNVSIAEAKAYLDQTSYTKKQKYALVYTLTNCKPANNPYN